MKHSKSIELVIECPSDSGMEEFGPGRIPFEAIPSKGELLRYEGSWKRCSRKEIEIDHDTVRITVGFITVKHIKKSPARIN